MNWFKRKKDNGPPNPLPLSDVEALRAQARALEARAKAQRNLNEMKARSAKAKTERHTNHFAPEIWAAMASRRKDD